MTRIIVDTGPLVAYFNRRDRWHRWVADQMAALNPPLVTCEAVLTEVCFLIQRAGGLELPDGRNRRIECDTKSLVEVVLTI